MRGEYGGMTSTLSCYRHASPTPVSYLGGVLEGDGLEGGVRGVRRVEDLPGRGRRVGGEGVVD